VAVRFGSFALAADSRRLTRGGDDLHLTPKAFDLLLLLVDAAPRVVPKGEIHRRLWPDSFVADTTLVGLVKEVRRVLDDTDAVSPIIRTVTRVGYAFAAPLHAADPPPGSRYWLVADGRSFPLTAGVNDIGRDSAASRVDTHASSSAATRPGSKTSAARTAPKSTAAPSACPCRCATAIAW